MVLPAAYKRSALQKALTSLTGAICHGLRIREIWAEVYLYCLPYWIWEKFRRVADSYTVSVVKKV